MDNKKYQSGYIGLVGRPNVGKSTLLNKLVGEPISIATHKAQTTRHRLLGIKTTDHAQYIYVDTPGFHLSNKDAINHYMNRMSIQTVEDVDVIIFICQGLSWAEEDTKLLKKIANTSTPVIAVVNKVDTIQEKGQLLPYIQGLAAKHDFKQVIPFSALKDNVDKIENVLLDYLPEGPQYFDAEQITDKNDRFIATERIREQIFVQLQDEVPYGCTVEIESFKEEPNITKINAIAWVNRDSQKAILIGKEGSRLKSISTAARRSLQDLFKQKVYLRVWVKVKSGWINDNDALEKLGYTDD